MQVKGNAQQEAIYTRPIASIAFSSVMGIQYDFVTDKRAKTGDPDVS